MMVSFSIHALMLGSLFSRVAEIQRDMGISEGVLGFALIGLPAGAFTSSFVASRAIERFGTKPIFIVLFPIFSIGPLLASLAPNALLLSAAFYLLGSLQMTCNITLNVEADRLEAATGKRIINRSHGFWGLGFLAASLTGTGMVAAGIAPTTHFFFLWVIVSAATALIIGPMIANPPRAHRGENGKRVRFALPTVATMLILGFALSGMWQATSVRNWSVIYMRDSYGIADWIATVALPSVMFMQTAGRFIADPIIARIGTVRFSASLSAISLAGLALVVAGNSVIVTLVGFGLVGLGISSVLPQAMSAVAKLGDRPSSQNIAAFAMMQTVMNMAAPPIFGLVAARYGMQTAFGMLLPLPLMAIWFSRFLAPRGDSPPS